MLLYSGSIFFALQKRSACSFCMYKAENVSSLDSRSLWNFNLVVLRICSGCKVGAGSVMNITRLFFVHLSLGLYNKVKGNLQLAKFSFSSSKMGSPGRTKHAYTH